jgi:hypothetical protein
MVQDLLESPLSRRDLPPNKALQPTAYSLRYAPVSGG